MKRATNLILVFQIICFLMIGGAQAFDSTNLEIEKLTSDSLNFTFGLGWAGNEFLGGITRDGLGYPKNAFGLNNWAGFSYTWIYGAPEKQEVTNTINAVLQENGNNNLKDYDLKYLTKKKLDKGSFTYFRLGTALLLYPVIAQYGWMLPVGDVGRFQFGLGLPLLLNLGINFDF